MGEIINLNKNIIESAKISACKINDKKARVRAFALNVAANATAQYLDNNGLQSDTSTSLYKIPSFEQDFEVADIYIKGFRLDVRISFDGQTFTIPKVHEKYSVQPLAYIVVKLDKKLEKIEFLGFVPTEGLQIPSSDSEYYTLSLDILKPMNTLKELIESSTLNIHPYSANCHEKIKELCVPFMDGEISESEKVFFIKHVLACPVCRETFCDINDFDTITAQIKNYQELLNDSTLSVLSGNQKEVDEAKFENLAFVENAEENTETLTEDIEEIKEENSIEEPLVSEEQENPIDLYETEEKPEKENTALDINPIPVVAPVPLVEVIPPLVDLSEPDMLSSVNLEISQEDNTLTTDTAEDEMLFDFDEEDQSEDKKEDQTENIQEDTKEVSEKDSLDVLEESDFKESETTKEVSEPDLLEIVDEETLELKEPEEPELLLEEKNKPEIDFDKEKQNEEFVDIWEENQGYGYPLTEDNNEKLKDEQEEPELLLEEDTDPNFDSHAEIQEENEKSLELLEENPIEPQEQSKSTDNLTETLTDIEPLEPLFEIDSVNETKFEENMEIEHIEEHEELQELSEDELISEHNELTAEEESTLALDEEGTFELLHEEESHIEETKLSDTPIEQAPSFELNVKDEEETLTEVNGEIEEQSVVEPKKNPYIQEPIELKYDDDEDKEFEEKTEPQSDEEFSSNFEQLPDEEKEDIVATEQTSVGEVDETSSPVEQEQPVSVENDELQNLLDEDLMSLLSEDDSMEETKKTTKEIDELAQESAQLIEEHQNKETKQENVQANDNIQSLFEKNESDSQESTNPQEFELAKEPLSEETMKKTKRVAVLAGLLVVLMAAGGGMLFVNHQKATNSNNDTSSNEQFFDSLNQASQNNEENQGVSQDINRSMTNSFSDKPAAITITKLSWQVSEKLALDPSVKEYLQTAGKNIQMNLQNDLANSADIAFNNSVKVSFVIAPDNTMKGMQILESSGSDKIDEEISKSIKNTLKYISVPKIKNNNSDYFLTLIINF